MEVRHGLSERITRQGYRQQRRNFFMSSRTYVYRSPTEYRDEGKLKCFNLNIKTQYYRNNWLQHLQEWKTSEYLVRLDKTIHRETSLERPRNRWLDQI
jgi:hypothetical protein